MSTVRKASFIETSAWVVTSIMSSVGLILTNKIIMAPPYNFVYVFTLTSIHFFVTGLTMELMALAGAFTRSRLPWIPTVLMAVTCSLSVAMTNSSLKLNSVGFYQLCKLLGIPFMVFIQAVFYKTHTSSAIKLSLFVILFGMGLATVTDVQVNVLGSIVGLIGVIITTQFQIWQGKNQHDYKLNAMQINYAQALPTFLACTLLALVIEFSGYYKNMYILSHTLTLQEIKWIGLSALLAACANLTCYGLIGSTSPVTFQVTGHVKTVLIIVGGYIMTRGEVEINGSNIVGALVCLFGSILYGTIRNAEQKNTNVSQYLSVSQLIKMCRQRFGQQKADEESAQSLIES